jgi:hypothetical protein
MDWLPTLVPPGIRVVISTTPDSPCLAAMHRRDPQPPHVVIPGLSEDEQRDIVVRQLQLFRKKLTDNQLRLVLNKAESYKPLYLLTAAEELRLQAQFGRTGTGVDDMIRTFPELVPDLMQVVLNRVERDIAQWVRSAELIDAEGWLLGTGADLHQLVQGGDWETGSASDSSVVSSSASQALHRLLPDENEEEKEEEVEVEEVAPEALGRARVEVAAAM